MKATFDNSFCMDSNCIHYFEDSCMICFEEKGTEVTPYTLEHIEKYGGHHSEECLEFRKGSHLVYLCDLTEDDFKEVVK